MEDSNTLKLPVLCANCGKQEPSFVWTIKATKIALDPLSLLTMIFGVLLTERSSYAFPVPVCAKCFSRLRVINRVLNILLTLGAFSVLLGFAGFIYLAANFDDRHEAALNLAFIGLVATPIIYFVKNYIAPIGSFDGTFYSFRNKNFHHEFTKLNPGWGRTREMMR